MNVVAFPLAQLGGDVLSAILRGGLDVVTEAGASVVGGHSIKVGRRLSAAFTAGVSADISPADVIANNQNDVGFAAGRASG